MSSESGHHCLKDISNTTPLRKVMVGPVNVAVDDKENADPRIGLDKPVVAVVKRPLPTFVIHPAPPEKLDDTVEMDNNDESSHDGFDVSEDLQLDEIEDTDNDDDTTDQAPKASNKVEESSPFVMSSLLNSRVVFKIDDGEDEIGASPMLAAQGRQERRRLDFSNVDNNVTAGGAVLKKFRRCVSMVERPALSLTTSNTSPELMVRGPKDFTSPVSRPFVSFKRPNAPTQPLQAIHNNHANVEQHHQPSKRVRRGDNSLLLPSAAFVGISKSASTSQIDSPQIAKPMFKLSLSESEANIKKACSLADVPNLTGDRSRQLSLPTVTGRGAKKNNLVNVDCHTVAGLIRGRFDHSVSSYRIIDARYIYEYEGGHIRGAENFGTWDEEAFFGEFLPEGLGPKRDVTDAAGKARVLIFHCEFSSVRGPGLMALLRNRDRELNKETYPALHYPECYLLCDGYKEFYANYPELCDPQNYVPMADPNYASEERKFHKKSRSWAPGGTIARIGSSSRLLKL